MVGLINSLIVMTLLFYCLQKMQIVYVEGKDMSQSGQAVY